MQKTSILLVLIIAIGIAFSLYYFVFQNSDMKEVTENPDEALNAIKEYKASINEIEKLNEQLKEQNIRIEDDDFNPATKSIE